MIVPITRKEKLLNAIATNGDVDFVPKTREELFLFKILGADVNTPTPITRKELLYQHIIGGTIPTFEPRTRLEKFIMVAAGAELELPVVLTREEYWWAEISDSAYETITGAIVHFIAKRARAIKSLIANISYTQDLNGYSYPWPAGGGVNLLDPAKCSVIGPSGAYGLTVTHDQATAIWTISGAPTLQNASLAFNFCTYSDFSLSGKGYQVQAFPISGTPIKNIYGFRNEAENRIAIIIDTVANPTVNVTFKVSVAATAQTAWSPYSNICPISGWTGANVYHSGADTSDATTYSITFPAAAGTVYGGTLDVTTGKLTVDRAMVDLGTLTWYTAASQRITRFRAPVIGIKQIGSPNVLGAIVCSSYATKTANQTYTGSLGISLQQNANDVYIYDPQKEAFSAADFKSAMSGVQLVYELATPQTYQLTPTEVTTLLGDNTIWADTGDVTVTY